MCSTPKTKPEQNWSTREVRKRILWLALMNVDTCIFQLVLWTLAFSGVCIDLSTCFYSIWCGIYGVMYYLWSWYGVQTPTFSKTPVIWAQYCNLLLTSILHDLRKKMKKNNYQNWPRRNSIYPSSLSVCNCSWSESQSIDIDFIEISAIYSKSMYIPYLLAFIEFKICIQMDNSYFDVKKSCMTKVWFYRIKKFVLFIRLPP